MQTVDHFGSWPAFAEKSIRVSAQRAYLLPDKALASSTMGERRVRPLPHHGAAVVLGRSLVVLLVISLLAVIASTSSLAQQTSLHRYVPPELQASDPDVKAIVDSVEKMQEEGNYSESFQQLQKALDLCVSKGFLADKALIEAKLGATYFLQGRLEDAKQQWLNSISDSVKANNLVLQADTLVALASMAQASGNLTQALDLANRALDLARRSKNFFIQSRCLGELGRLQLTMNKPEEARASVEEALHIDRLNQYNWEAGHLLYLAWITYGDSKLDEAIRLANSARELAIKQEDYLTFMQASESLGQTYVKKKELTQAIAFLQRSRDGVAESGKPLFQHPASYRSAMSLPYPKIVFLEAIALAYQAGQRTDDALKAWQELYDTAQTAGFTLASAEAAHHMGDLWQTKKEPGKAITNYGLAAEAWTKGGNTSRRIDALASQAFLLGQQGKSEEALQIYEHLIPLAQEIGDLRRRFLFNLAKAELLQPKGDMDRTARALQNAESLLSADLTLTDIDPRLVLETYLRLADLYEKKNDPLQQLVALEKAMTAAEAIGAEAKTLSLKLVKEKIISFHVQDAAEKAYQSGNLAAALIAFELVQHFEQIDAKWNGLDYNKNLNDPIAAKLLEIPGKIAAQPDGASVLETNITEMGPIVGMARLPILVALSTHYIELQQADMAVKFESQAMQYVNLERPGMWDVAVVCQLAIGLMVQKDFDSAVKRIGQCLRGAIQVGDPQLLASAHQTNVWIFEAAGRREEAKESVQYLIQHAPADPLIYMQKAQLDVQQGKNTDAVEAWKRAIQLFEARGDIRAAAAVHVFIANLLHSAYMPDGEEAKTHLEAAMELYKQLGGPKQSYELFGQVTALSGLAEYSWKKQGKSKAQTYFDAALKLSRQAKKPDLEARVLSQMGDLYLSEKPDQALELYRQAEAIYHKMNDNADEASQLRNEAVALDALHQPEEALEVALKAKRIADASGSWIPRYWVRKLLGNLYARRGEYEAGLAVLREARAISDSANQPLSSAWAALALASGLTTIGDWAEARDQLDFALPVFGKFNDTDDEFAAYSLLIDIYGARESELRDFNKAEEYYQPANRLVEKKDKARAADLALAAEEIYVQQGRFKEAISRATEALEYYREIKDEWGQASALISLAEAQRSTGDTRTAALNLSGAEPFVKRAHSFYMTGRFHYGQANQRKSERRFTEAIAEYERVIAMLEQFKSTSDLGARRKVSETYGFIYDELIDVYYSLGVQNPRAVNLSASKALEYAELNKSRVFTSSWGRSFVETLRRRLPARLQESERTLLARQQSLQSELERSRSGAGQRLAKQVRSDLDALAKEQAALQQELRQGNPAYAEASYPLPVSLSRLPLHPGETLIEFKSLRDALFVWIIRGAQNAPDVVAFYKVVRPHQWFVDRIVAIRDAFNRGQSDQFDPLISEELFNTIFPAPFAQYVTNAQSVVFIPDDILFLLPFEILSPKAAQSQFVLLRTPTTYFPSAAALRLSRALTPGQSGWTSQFFGLADPITSINDDRYGTASIVSEVELLKPQPKSADPQLPAQNSLPPDQKLRDYFFSRLPDTATEVSNIAALFSSDPSAAVVRTGMDARKRELLQTDLGRFRFLHFATHGFFPVEPGIREPALVLSYDGKEEARMMLTLSEILQLRLHAEMVVLSACNTGSGKVTRAEGVASLGTAFLAAGASSATVSLWKVSDKSTAILMQEFYRNLLSGMTKAAALAQARSALVAKGYRNPFFWAPFVLTGE